MIRLFDNESDEEIGSINESQFSVLQEQLIEETLDTNTYNLDVAVLDSLEANGLDGGIVALLRKALKERSSMELRYDFD